MAGMLSEKIYQGLEPGVMTRRHETPRRQAAFFVLLPAADKDSPVEAGLNDGILLRQGFLLR